MNPNGIRFYSALIDELIKHGIHPVLPCHALACMLPAWLSSRHRRPVPQVATLYHWDLPLPLQMEKDGWLSHSTANAFVAYARVCFERCGSAWRRGGRHSGKGGSAATARR